MFGVYLPIFPRGFDDYTPALYTYLTVPFVYLFDLSPFSTRLASVWVGVFAVVISYHAIRYVFGSTSALMGATFLAISPWHIFLNRVGTEWGLLGLGPMLTLVLAYRGLRHAKWLIAAGVVGGISLYGYAPTKAFLPILCAIFAIFYRRELIRQKKMVLISVCCFILLAFPIYFFSFTPKGMLRFQKVAAVDISYNFLSFFLSSYFSYFDPRFLFARGAQVITEELEAHYFWLSWLAIAPIGINLHTQGPTPALWLSATPTLQGLAGFGLYQVIRSVTIFKFITWRVVAATVFLVFLSAQATLNVTYMLRDLFIEFPVYSTHSGHWAYGLKQGVQDLEQSRSSFDQVILHPFDLDYLSNLSGIYFAYYTRLSPSQRHNEVKTYPENSWQHIDSVSVGLIETHLRQEGCHLVLTTVDKLSTMKLPRLDLVSYKSADDQINDLRLSVVANPQDGVHPMGAVFGGQILLKDFVYVSENSNNSYMASPGQAICIILNWQSAGGISTDYTSFVHLIGPMNPGTNTPLWSQHDGVPGNGFRPTSTWRIGEAINDLHVIFIPANVPEGSYELVAGLYNPATGKRLKVLDGDRHNDQVGLVTLTLSNKNLTR
jgi:hypothetical protein